MNHFHSLGLRERSLGLVVMVAFVLEMIWRQISGVFEQRVGCRASACRLSGALYWQRWRIEDAYAIVKRLLGLAYFWCGAQNVVEIQVWTTWLLYAVLVDLTDSVAEALNQPFAAISIEMVYRSLYFFTQAHHRGQADDLVAYLAANTKLLGIVKRKRKSAHPHILHHWNSFLS